MSKTKKVIVTGCTGQAGSLMVEYLLKNTDHEIYGMVRRLSVNNHKNIERFKNNPRFCLFSGDLTDGHSLTKSIEEIKPDFYIGAGAQSFVQESWVSPVNTFQTDSVSIIYILEAIRKFVPKCRFINFASSEMFGDVQYSPQDINHPFRSRSPYACAKVAAHQLVKVYRESYGLYCVSIVAFNYEGPYRGSEFVSKKITEGVARLYHSFKNHQLSEPIELGNLESRRDWSDAEDVIDAVWRMLNQEVYNEDIQYELSLETVNKWQCLIKNLKEYVVASGETHSIREFIELAFKIARYDIPTGWVGSGSEERFVTWSRGVNIGESEVRDHEVPLVKINPKFYRPAEVDVLCGDSIPIRKELGWQPKTNFSGLVKKMVQHDIENFKA